MTWSPDRDKNSAFEHGEVGKIRWEVLPYTQGRGLDVGCGTAKLWRSSIGIDEGPGAANLTADVRRLDLIASESVDYVFSSHCLEHVEDYAAALAEWWRVVKVGGHLALYLPHADLYPRRGQPGANPDHKHDFLPEDIVRTMQERAPDWALVENQVRGEGDEYSFLQVYRKRAPGKGQGTVVQELEPKKRCIVVRYGGYGDVLVAASTFPHLKAEGWHVTVYTGAEGARILRHDPHVDRLCVNDVTRLAQRELDALCRYLRKRCARFVNFSETFEGLLIASPTRPAFHWPHAMRERVFGGNYLEAAHAAADVPQEWHQRFHATPTERAEARAWRADKPRLVVLGLSGTGVFKWWPHAGAFVERLLAACPDVHVALTGEARGLQFPDSRRLHRLFTSWPMRRTLALAQAADLVIGPETGLLNAVAFEPMAKIVLLSHSSAANLTQHWTNTAALAGDVSCHPCHRLHAGWDSCNRDEATKAAACQAAIAPQRVLAEALGRLEHRKAA